MTRRLSKAEKYFNGVISGRINVCQWVRKACERHMRDLQTADERGLYFDRKAAVYAEDYFSEVLRHPKDSILSSAGEPFALEGWELAMIIWPVFGWKRADGTRRFRRAYVEVPKKNGKSSISAGIADLLLTADGEHSAEVYSVAGSREQAALVFDIAKSMVEMSPELGERCEVFRRSIIYKDAFSVYKVMSSDAPMAHGVNAHGIIFDELHVQPNRELFDALWGAGKARKQPLFVMLTTAGWDRQSVCYEMHDYTEQVLDGVIKDDSFWGVIYGMDEGDDWLSPKIWRKANPNLGVTIGLDAVAEEAKQAKAIPGYQNAFKRLTLDVWTEQETRTITAEMWNECQSAAAIPLEGRACFGGLDLASSNDIAAFVLDFPLEGGLQRWLPFFWIPEENLHERGISHGVNYEAWKRDGFLHTTPGNTIDLRQIVAEIEELHGIYNIRCIAFDRWGAREIVADLQDSGLTMVDFGQGFKSLAAPTKEFLRLVAGKQLQHDGHPVLRWMANNLVTEQDAAGNLKPNKKKSKEKIDGIVAGIMALDMALRNETVDLSGILDEDWGM